MPGDDSSSTSTAILAPTTTAIPTHSPYFLHASDQPGTALVTPVLNGDNFPTWHRAMVMALEAKNKLQFLDGSLPKPDSDSTDLSHWTRCNSMVRSWILHSIVPNIAHSILWIDSARDAWLDLHDHFSQKNAPWIFEIRKSISTLSQGLDSISAYYTKLKSLRDELSSYRAMPTCTCGTAATLQGHVKSNSLMDFLQGFT
ncbi:uncharacterized protein LOC122655259 [Telopea speciosissima]|uniref:uncharacterized protein LOC122655259 n=1 Tax=Telopea speciosissima TaxID=54955 RepID=UPI001CC6C290|nr:uncharacterized protein LOC122655259 [Telopea speciosissima]